MKPTETHPSVRSPLIQDNSKDICNLKGLRSLLNNEGAEFQSIEQSQALNAVMSGKNALVVLPTGGGKTLTYTLPAFIENKRWESPSSLTTFITVVILPLVILKSDQHRRLTEYPLKVKIWDMDTLRLDDNALRLTVQDDVADLVLVGLEVAVSDLFNSWLRSKAAMNKLKRIIIDEAHLLLDQSDFRVLMIKIASIRSTDIMARIPLIAVTATMPPRRTSQLFAFMGMSPEQVITVRACTDRKNLRYNVLKVEKDIKTSLISSVKRFRDKEHLLDGTAKMMIFCPTIVAVADIAKQLEKENIATVVYMGKTLTRQEKEQAWDRFISPTGPFVLVGTHAAGLGADYSNIRHVYIYGACSSLGLFIQLSGRAGRDGKPADVSFVWSEDSLAAYTRDFRCENDQEFAYLASMAKNEDTCIRKILVEHNDGGNYTTCLCFPDSQYCSRCDAQLRNADVQLQALAHQNDAKDVLTNDAWTRTDTLLSDIENYLHALIIHPNVTSAQICITCFLKCDPEGFTHARECGCAAKRHACFKCLQSGHGAKNCPNKLSFQPHLTCYYCALPVDNLQGHNFHFESFGTAEAYSCTSGGKDFIIPVCLALFATESILRWPALRNFFGGDNITFDTYRSWLSSISDQTNGLTNTLHMFKYICYVRAELMANPNINIGDFDDVNDDSGYRHIGKRQKMGDEINKNI
jgi:superfamily II DNA helicase RecQ